MSQLKRFAMLFIIPEVDTTKVSDPQTENDPEVLKVWNEWFNKLISKGIFVSTEQLELKGKVVKSNKEVVDGPFTELREIIGGLVIVKAKDIDEAIEYAKDCPILYVNGRVDVRPLVEHDNY